MNDLFAHLPAMTPNEELGKYLSAVRRYPSAECLILNHKLRPPTIEPSSSSSYCPFSFKAIKKNPTLIAENRAIIDDFIEVLRTLYGEKIMNFAFPEEKRLTALDHGLSSKMIVESLCSATSGSYQRHFISPK
ncbi:MAG: hypothetical protein A3F67_09515 [Verrucomicrobia bacterium RIFCSPHIGHO2_12_FULL_41_10]|nr:MAG: hypothetical protein A3F67_09515 [Verrucomicrobia bacterium RIFCSPHIGHO2_12_FULL_41_10]HLB34721.1 hypothetical protein [Chthoniobacterales bacterium]